MPIPNPATNPVQLQQLEAWLRSYRPEELFDEAGRLTPELQALAPKGQRRISANPHANGGVVCVPLDLPPFCNYAVEVKQPGKAYACPTEVLATFLRDVMHRNMTSFRVFGPDETASNRLTAIYGATKKRGRVNSCPKTSMVVNSHPTAA